jgi:ABC-type Co2+ transport system permease subunit
MPIGISGPRKLTAGWRAIVEVGIIVFLFYSTRLMREFTQTNGQGKSFVFAVADIFTVNTLVVAVISGLIACMIFEYLRKQR